MYTIKQAAEKMNLTTATLRYYDKQGLLPFVERSESGYRMFSENDMGMLRVIECLKKTGMPIKDIQQFCKWVQMGDDSLQERYDMFLERKRAVEEQLAEIQETLKFVNHKCEYYRTALEAGTEKIHFQNNDSLPCEETEQSNDSNEKVVEFSRKKR